MIAHKKILVAGAGGFIGSHIARTLFEQNNFVRAVDIKWDNYLSEPSCNEKLTLDLREQENCRTATAGIDYVFNHAANMGGIGFITATGADIMYDNVLINAHLARACVDNGVARLFFSSSACVYPAYRQKTAQVTPLKEDDANPADPDTFYGWEKLYTEKMLAAFRKDYSLDIRIARFHNIYGPEGTYDGGREKSPAALCRKVALAKNHESIEIWGDGNQTRSYCYITDCVEGVLRLMESGYVEPLNIGSDRLVTINEVADIIISLSGKSIEKTYNNAAPQGVRGRNCDNTLLRQTLRWEPRVSLEDGLAQTYRWIESELRRKGAL